jgi:hypothetical protein
MSRVPVKFRETVSVSKEVKDFMRKCLEIDENRRVGLTDLRNWINETPKLPEMKPKMHSLQEKKLSPPSLIQNENNGLPVG